MARYWAAVSHMRLGGRLSCSVLRAGPQMVVDVQCHGRFGKRLLVTDRQDWPGAEVVTGYRSQFDAEAGFHQLEDPKVVSFTPMWHWSDAHIRFHVSYCVTALALAHLMRRQATQARHHDECA